MIHQILKYGQEALRHKARPVTAVTDELRAIAQDMLETMRVARGVGLAAEQIGREEALCVVDVPPEAEKPECIEANAAVRMPLVMFNPEIVATEGQQRSDEGCLSFPDISCPITRPAKVTATYLDIQGQRQTAVAHGLLARAIMHETDHLHGVLLVDRMSPMQRMAMAGRLKRLQQQSLAACRA